MLKHVLVLLFLISLQTNCIAQEKIKNLSLKNALEIGLQNHPEIHKSRQNIEAYQGRYSRDLSPGPLSVSISNEFIPNGSGISNFNERTIEITQGFDFPTLYFAKSSRANSEIISAEMELEHTQISVKSQVKKAYYNSLAKQLLLKVAEENLKIATEFFKKADIRYKVGEGTNLELLTAKVQFSEANSLIGLARKEYSTALNQLHYSLGYSIEIDFDNIIFSDTLSYNKLNLSLDELINKSLQSNPILKKANYDLESSGTSLSIANMSYIPTFEAAYMFQATNNSTGYYGLRLGMNLPLWFMFDQKGQVREANANYQINLYEIQNIKNSVIENINTAYIDYVSDDLQLQLYQNELLPQAEEIFKTADLSYQAGEISYLEFLQAKFTTINTRTNLIKSLFDYKEAIINLEESTGISLE